jgi:hypothetical protein
MSKADQAAVTQQQVSPLQVAEHPAQSGTLAPVPWQGDDLADHPAGQVQQRQKLGHRIGTAGSPLVLRPTVSVGQFLGILRQETAAIRQFHSQPFPRRHTALASDLANMFHQAQQDLQRQPLPCRVDRLGRDLDLGHTPEPLQGDVAQKLQN